MMSQRLDFKLIYISTDYIFDGNAPPEGYDVDAEPKSAPPTTPSDSTLTDRRGGRPTNLYGETKLAGERAVLTTGVTGQVASLRVPVLYGKAEHNSESAVNVLVDGVRKAATGEQVKMDDWATRYPTLVDDVAKVLEGLVGTCSHFARGEEAELSAALDKPLPPRLNFSSQKLYTVRPQSPPRTTPS